MKLDYTKQELALQLASLAQVLGTAQVIDPYRGALLDPATLEPCGESDPVPTLDEDGRGMQLIQAESGDEMRLYQSIRVEDKPCVLAVHCALPRYRGASAGAKNSYDRALAQYCADMRHDYVTGVYNARFLEEEYRAYAEKQAMHGQPVGAVLLRVKARRAGPPRGRHLCGHHRRHAGRPPGPKHQRSARSLAPGVQHHAGAPRHLYGVGRQRRMGRNFLVGDDARPGPAAAVIPA